MDILLSLLGNSMSLRTCILLEVEDTRSLSGNWYSLPRVLMLTRDDRLPGERGMLKIFVVLKASKGFGSFVSMSWEGSDIDRLCRLTIAGY